MKQLTKKILKFANISANCGPIGAIFGMTCFFMKHYPHTEFHANRIRIRHSCHTKSKSRIFAMVTAKVVVRFCPFTIPVYSSSVQTFWLLFHKNWYTFCSNMNETLSIERSPDDIWPNFFFINW